jgi:hypothetical protein
MTEIVGLKARREALAAAEATDLLHAGLSSAAAECAAGELSAARRKVLICGLLGTFGFGDSGGWSIARNARAGDAKPNDVLHKVLNKAAEEAATRVLSAEDRAIFIRAVFRALGSGWKVERVA